MTPIAIQRLALPMAARVVLQDLVELAYQRGTGEWRADPPARKEWAAAMRMGEKALWAAVRELRDAGWVEAMIDRGPHAPSYDLAPSLFENRKKGTPRVDGMGTPPEKGNPRVDEMGTPPEKGNPRVDEMGTPPEMGSPRVDETGDPLAREGAPAGARYFSSPYPHSSSSYFSSPYPHSSSSGSPGLASSPGETVIPDLTPHPRDTVELRVRQVLSVARRAPYRWTLFAENVRPWVAAGMGSPDFERAMRLAIEACGQKPPWAYLEACLQSVADAMAGRAPPVGMTERDAEWAVVDRQWQRENGYPVTGEQEGKVLRWPVKRNRDA